MSWRATGVAGLCAAAAFAQTQPDVRTIVPSPGARAGVARTLRQFMKDARPTQAAMCSIPLTEVPIPRNMHSRMKILRPPAPVEPMPSVPLPAPPCKEEKR
jgi:hypothetical protein